MIMANPGCWLVIELLDVSDSEILNMGLKWD